MSISSSKSIWCTLCSTLSTLLSTTFVCNSGSSWSSRPTLFDEEIAGWHRWINGTGVAGKGQQDAQKQSVPCSAGESFMFFFRECHSFPKLPDKLLFKDVRCNLDVCPELMSRNQRIVQRGWLILIPHEDKVDVTSPINILFEKVANFDPS